MRSYFLVLLVLVLFSCTEEETTNVMSTFPNGNQKVTQTFNGSSKSILKERHFNEDGQLILENLYDDKGEEKVFQTEFNPDGSIKMSGELKNELRFGVWKALFPSGELQTLANYNDKGKEEGLYKVFAKTDGHYHLFYKGYYKNGEKRGVWEFFNKEGVVVKKTDFSIKKESD